MHNSGNRAEPMPEEQFLRICKALERQGVVVWMDDDADYICKKQGADAFTLNENTVAFSKNPSRSVVYEELIHLWQYATRKCDGTRLSRIKCEIEAKEKLIHYCKYYQLTSLDIILTKKALAADYADLKEFYEGGI